MTRYRASWIVPVSQPPIREGWVAVDRGRVVGLGCRGDAGESGRDVDLGEVAILPGLVNAHTHLELSYLRDRVGPSDRFITWVRAIIAAQRNRAESRAPEILAAVDRAVAEMIACGTAVVGDITNTLATFSSLARSPLAGVLFYELIRFNPPDPDGLVERALAEIETLRPTERIRASLAAHAPYSVSPLLLRAIKRGIDRAPFGACSVHLAESAEEMEFIEKGTGPWRELLEELGAWDRAWSVPGVTPVQYLDDIGFLDPRVLAVHGVQMTPADVARLAERGTTLVTCPRSNAHTGAGAPPVEEFYRAGVRVAVGTDSLASAPDLNILAELATLRTLAPGVPPAALLDSATRQGARALGFEADYGTIEPGKAARLLAISVPSGIDDVEECLVSGISPDQMRWVE